MPGSERQGSWVEIYTGHGVTLRQIESALEARGFAVARLRVPGLFDHHRASTSAPEQIEYTLSIPLEEYRGREEEIRSVIAAATGTAPSDLEALQEAEEDYDVRACPACLLFLHETFDACPGCGALPVPAVEVFEAGTTAPDRVIVATGAAAEMKRLSERFQEAGFGAEAFEVEEWPVAAVDLSWDELTERTADAEALLRGVL
jgi:hypothetical protein